jgi:hypothetical protein
MDPYPHLQNSPEEQTEEPIVQALLASPVPFFITVSLTSEDREIRVCAQLDNSAQVRSTETPQLAHEMFNISRLLQFWVGDFWRQPFDAAAAPHCISIQADYFCCIQKKRTRLHLRRYSAR